MFTKCDLFLVVLEVQFLFHKKKKFSLGLQIEVLPEIVEAVRGTGVEVYLDSGVRLGTDVLKALALGARAVFVGRPVIWGLAYKGEQGVFEVLQKLKDELKIAMALAGCASLKDITPSLVMRSAVSHL